MEAFAVFIINSALLGAGLAMDAFSVSLANGLNEPRMTLRKTCAIAGTFGFFQALMPLIGWLCVRTVAQRFTAFQKFIPWIALTLLLFIGGSMLWEGLGRKEGDAPPPAVGSGGLLLQGVATSIDALSVGFTIAEYPLASALTAALIVAGVTFLLCLTGLRLGKRFGTRLAGRASILGGVILIAIGLEILAGGIAPGGSLSSLRL